ncbi:MAG: hypothetical protein ACYTFM_08650 [Planctomycetota bacterium]|jgi:hypothetical protein
MQVVENYFVSTENMPFEAANVIIQLVSLTHDFQEVDNDTGYESSEQFCLKEKTQPINLFENDRGLAVKLELD